MILMSRNVSRKLWCCFLILFLLPLFNAENHFLRRRMKRISSPNFDEKKTLDLAKYVVSIRSRTPREYFGDNHFCAGTIISHMFVLTSAHCVMDKRKIMYRSRVFAVVAGTANRLKYHADVSLNIPVKKIFVPVNFTIYNTNNIALMKLSQSLSTNNPRVGIIKLPTAEPQTGMNYTVVGWGRMYKGGPLAANILHIDVELIPWNTCDKLLTHFKREMMCAGNLKNNLDENPCAGDTGGPLIFNETVYGVVSYRIGCGAATLPSVYTNVHSHMPWIKSIMDANRGGRVRDFFQIVVTTSSILVGITTLNNYGSLFNYKS